MTDLRALLSAFGRIVEVPEVYVAGSSQERVRCRAVMDALKAEPSCALTYDWLADIEANGGVANAGLSAFQQRRARIACLNAVKTCDLFVFLVPHAQTRGAWVELGYALHMCKPIWIGGLSDDAKQTIFLGPRDDAEIRAFGEHARFLVRTPQAALDENIGQVERARIIAEAQSEADSLLLKYLIAWADLAATLQARSSEVR